MTAELSWSRARIDALADDIAEAAAHVDAATHRLLTLIRSFDRARGWHDQGALSCAHWLSWRIGLGLGPAREKLRVAHALADLPRIDDALRRGELSYSKVRAMTRVATTDNEADLLNMARRTTASQLERICRLLRQVRSLAGADPRRIEEYERRVTSHPTDDGMVSVQLRLLPDEAARVMRAIQLCAAGGPLADGAVALAETALAGSSAAAAAAADRAIRPPVEVVLHVSADTLAGRTELGDGVPAETSRRLLCDAGIVPTLDAAAGNTVDIGRKTRTIPTALRRALWQRDHGCRFPGCSNLRFVDAHHVEHWIDGGATSLGNTILLCRRHHRYVHEYGFSLALEAGEPVFRDSRGNVIPPAATRRPLASPVVVPHPSQPSITAATNAPGWDGLAVDYERCVDALAWLDRAAITATG